MWATPCELAGCCVTAGSYGPKRKSKDECGKLGSGKSRAVILCFHTLVIAFQVMRVAGQQYFRSWETGLVASGLNYLPPSSSMSLPVYEVDSCMICICG